MTLVGDPATLLLCLLMVLAVAGTVWVGLGGIAKLAPRASYLLAAANTAAAAALAWHALQSRPGSPLPDWPGDVLGLGAFALLHAAVPAITRRTLAWRTATVAFLLTAPLLILLSDNDAGTPLLCAAAAGLTLWTGVDAWRELRAGNARQELGRTIPAPLTLTSPLLLIGALAALRGLQTWLPGGSGRIIQDPSLLLEAFVLVVLLNATLAFLVLMRLLLRLEHLIDHDPLTQVLNRRAFARALAEAQAGWRRGRGYALVMIDMDHFKRLNDDLGHAAGDAALLQMVRDIQPCLREADRLGRLGGEEFCVLLTLTDLAGAALVAERMRAIIVGSPLRWRGQDRPLSASFGVAEAEAGDASAEAVMARADAALYRAKSQGRNVVQA